MGLYSLFHALVRLACVTGHELLMWWQGWLRRHLEDHHHHEEQTEECVVSTKNGCVRGKVITLSRGRCNKEPQGVNAFLGVPFAVVGDYGERFKKPEPVEPWQGVRDCVEYGPRSIQQEMIWDRFLMPVRQDERHCLNMNIFAPRWPCPPEFPNGRAVLVFVHGGGYLIHGASNYGDWNICRNLCLHDVVVCVIQYRLGLLGFLSSGDKSCPGNFGLWDQLEAFKWIKENIASFGGDHTNVTAVGQSAGGACVDLLSLCPQSEGLISRIILMGGNANGKWALSTPERTMSEAITIARKAGWTGAEEDREGLVEFLKQQPPSSLQASLVGKSPFNLMKSGLKLCPVVDGELLPKPVPALRRDAPPITVIIGAAEYEALLFHALGRSQADLTSIRKLLKLCIPDDLQNHASLRREAEDLYVCGMNPSDREAVSRAFLALYSDILMNNSVARYCDEMVAAGHCVYLYNFTYFHQEQFGFFGTRMPFLAATHCHDLRYLLGKGLYSKFRPNHDDFEMIDMVTTLWTDFAKYGDPNSSEFAVRWEPLKADDVYKHLKLDLEPEIASDFHARRYEFWRNIDEMRASLA